MNLKKNNTIKKKKNNKKNMLFEIKLFKCNVIKCKFVFPVMGIHDP